MDGFQSVLRTVFSTPGAVSIEDALERASAAQRSPEFERRLDARRAELATQRDEELRALADRYGFEPRHYAGARSLLIEGLARHEVARDLTVEMYRGE